MTRSGDKYEVPAAPFPVRGSVALPGSKSYTNRALPIAALAKGNSTLVGALDSDDTRYMVAALQSLGISIVIDWDRERIEIEGCGGDLPASSGDLYLGNSGTSMRFLAALTTLGRGRFRLDGNERMRGRPLGPLLDGLRSLDITIDCEFSDGYPPIVIHARGLPGGVLAMPGDVSSQYFSAVAMVLPYAEARLEVRVVGELVSKPYLDLTGDAMSQFGVQLHHHAYSRIWVDPGQSYTGRTFDIEPDASAASYFYALAAVTGGRISVERLSSASHQGDLRFVDLLARMGCSVERGEHDITVSGPRRLHGIDVDMNDISDTVQTLAAIAPFADSPVTIRNVGHIRFKETDRIEAVVTELRRMGARVDDGEDWLTIHPSSLRPAVIQTYDDHRMAMSFAVTASQVPGTVIANPDCVSKTVPRFWDILGPLLTTGG